jgi:hypothetical protein
MTVRRLGDVKDIAGCHILFVGPSERRKLPAILQTLGKFPTLTVGEDDDFVPRRRLHALLPARRQGAFEINMAVHRAGRRQGQRQAAQPGARGRQEGGKD